MQQIFDLSDEQAFLACVVIVAMFALVIGLMFWLGQQAVSRGKETEPCP